MKMYQSGLCLEGAVTPSVVCLGVFDGVHLGHARLIQTALNIAKEKNLMPIVHTYDPLPGQVLTPERGITELTTLQERLHLMEALGAKTTAVSQFDRELSRMGGADFFHQILVKELKAKHIVAGFNHRFGFRADTGIEELRRLCEAEGIGLDVIEPVLTREGSLVSSTAIRAALLLGDLELAEEMLGRPVDAGMLARVNQTYSHTTQKNLEG